MYIGFNGGGSDTSRVPHGEPYAVPRRLSSQPGVCTRLGRTWVLPFVIQCAMMKRNLAVLSFLLAAVASSFAGELPAWPNATREMKPWVYNWWMGSAVDAAGLETQCRELAEKGFGGIPRDSDLRRERSRQRLSRPVEAVAVARMNRRVEPGGAHGACARPRHRSHDGVRLVFRRTVD